MSITLNLTTLTDVKNYLKLNTTDATRDGILTLIIAAVEEKIKQYCHTDFKQTTYTNEYYDGDGTPILVVKHFPIISVASLYDDPDREFGSNSLIQATDYVIYKEKGIIKLIQDNDLITLTGEFSLGQQNIKITYDAGYTTVPYQIQLATIMWSVIQYNNYFNNTPGVSSRTVGDKTTRYNVEEMPIEVKGLIDTFRIPLVG